jgi:hypothetical protein
MTPHDGQKSREDDADRHCLRTHAQDGTFTNRISQRTVYRGGAGPLHRLGVVVISFFVYARHIRIAGGFELWFAWHVPGYILFNKAGPDPTLPFAVILFPFSIILTWVYLCSNQSLVLPIFLHGSINASFYAMEELLERERFSASL